VQASYVIKPYDAIVERAGSSVNVTYAATKDLSRAAQLAMDAEVAVIFVGTPSGEGSDRDSIKLDSAQITLIQTVCKVQPRTVVVAHVPGTLVMSDWEPCVQAIVIAWMPGQEDGHAAADILFGDVNPSGRLPVTFPAKSDDNPVGTPQQYPGVNDQADYSEGLLIGYRWFDSNMVSPLFPFGHGLSYTTFSYSDLIVSGRQISFSVKNIGKHDGDEIAQLYLGYPSSAGEPPKVLRGFRKVHLTIGMSGPVTFSLSDQDFSIWDTSAHNWKVVKGQYIVYVGASSRDIRLTGFLNV